MTENQAATLILGDMPIQTDKEIKANRLHTVVKNKDRTCPLIDLSIPQKRIPL